MCWSFLPIGIRQAKIRKKAEMQVLFLLKTSLAIQNTISFAPRTLRLLPIHISLHLPQRDKKTRKSTEKISSLLWNVMSAYQMCWCVTTLNASLLHLSCASWDYVCIVSFTSCISPLTSFHLLPLSFLSLFVRSGFVTRAYMCARITQRSYVFLLSHLSHAGKKRVNLSTKIPTWQSPIELKNREKHLDKILFSKNCLQITLWCWNRVD